MNPLIDGLELDSLGRIVLSDEHLGLIESHTGFFTTAGGTNGNCNNSNCNGTSNNVCNNAPFCEGSHNRYCYDSPIG